MDDLSVFRCFLGFRDVVKAMRMKFRVMEPKMNFPVNNCALKLPTMH